MNLQVIQSWKILLVKIRSDPNIRGVGGIRGKLGTEIKVTSFADDCTYFLRDKQSTLLVLLYIDQFSKISGLEINKTKLECLLLDFEQQLGDGTDRFAAIPLVEALKIIFILDIHIRMYIHLMSK